MISKQRLSFRSLCLFVPLFLSRYVLGGHSSNSTYLKKDVVIIGGGSSGTYTAIRLQQEGKSVAVIERKSQLGGHVNTYADKGTNKTFDIGTLVFYSAPLVTDYLTYLGVQWTDYSGPEASYIDFAGKQQISQAEVTNLTGNGLQAVGTWLQHVAQYPYLAGPGYHLPDPIPEELLLPYGDYLAKYNMSALATETFYLTASGNILAHPTMYMMKYLPAATFTNALITQVDGDNQAIYDAALKKLESGNNTEVFLNSDVNSVHRSNNTVEVNFCSPDGDMTISASQLVMAIPPIPNTLPFLDLTLDECSLLDQFNASYIWTAVLLDTNLPGNKTFQNFDPKAAAGIPAMPAEVFIYPSKNIPGAWATEITSPFYLPDDLVKEMMLANLAELQAIENVTNGTSQPQLTYFQGHTPYFFTVANKSIQNGFYDQVNAFQGEQRTWWIGSAFSTEYSPIIWNTTELDILPGLLNALK